MPNSVTAIGDYAFSYCNRLTIVTLSANLTTIGKEGFSYTNLSDIAIPASVTQIGEGAFVHLAQS